MVSSTLLDQAEDVAHAQNALRDAVGMEGFESVGLFAYADELERLAGYGANRERRAAAGVAVHLGENSPGDAEALVEFIGGFDGVLAGHGVGDEQDFGGVEQVFELAQLGHQIFVDVEAAGGVDQHHVAAGLDGFFASRTREIDRLGFFRARLRRRGA